KPVLILWVGIWAGALYALAVRWVAARWLSARTVLSSEGVMLGGMVCACAVLGLALLPRTGDAAGPAVAGAGGVQGEGSCRASRRLPLTPVGVAWKFEAKERGSFSSTPVVVGDRVYAAAAHGTAFAAWGTLYCLDRDTGKLIWAFNDNETMRQVFSTPAVVDGRIYVGEGFHQDRDCKLYCLDALTGQKVWEFITT